MDNSAYSPSTDSLFHSNIREEYAGKMNASSTAGKQRSGYTTTSKVKKISLEESWFSQEKIKEAYEKYFVVEGCPKSLKLIVAFYRIFGFSFSGLVFKTNSSHFKLSLQSLLFIILNLLMVGLYTWPFLYTDKSISMLTNTTVAIVDSKAVNASKLEVNLKQVFTEMGKDEDWHTLKPILRYIIESLRYGFLINGVISFLVNLLFGSRAIRQICQIPNIGLIDKDNWRAGKMLLAVVGTITSILTLGLVMFNRGIFVTLAWLAFKSEAVKREDVVLMEKTLFVWAMYFVNFVILTMGTVLFCYVMAMFDENVKMIIEGLKNVNLDELALYKVKNDCATLNEHFKAVISRCFAVPLTIDMILNTLLLIASSCFLMINQGKERYYLTTVFGLGAFSMARLVIVCVAGNAVSNNFRELIREIYEQVPEWDLGTWMCFLEIKAMQEQFEVSVSGGVYTVRQSAILTVLGFALNYIVVLLQTENYSGGEGAAVTTTPASAG